ncbi:hypothetical protein [Sandarakinorhabdus sp.]|uniref:hypothetical protein n=1 Tax=Sandarakinorhabdus sp. TaxID=1916663 RepID=UPI00286D944C|nr:hypothetical protein [Sandarakinorhabdus sp.]
MAEDTPRPDGRLPPARSGTSGWLIGVLVLVGIVVAAFAFGLVDIDQTRTTKLPDVNVSAKGGQTPSFDVDTAKIDVGTKEETIKVPTVDVEPVGDPESSK